MADLKQAVSDLIGAGAAPTRLYVISISSVAESAKCFLIPADVRLVVAAPSDSAGPSALWQGRGLVITEELLSTSWSLLHELFPSNTQFLCIVAGARQEVQALAPRNVVAHSTVPNFAALVLSGLPTTSRNVVNRKFARAIRDPRIFHLQSASTVTELCTICDEPGGVAEYVVGLLTVAGVVVLGASGEVVLVEQALRKLGIPVHDSLPPQSDTGCDIQPTVLTTRVTAPPKADTLVSKLEPEALPQPQQVVHPIEAEKETIAEVGQESSSDSDSSSSDSDADESQSETSNTDVYALEAAANTDAACILGLKQDEEADKETTEGRHIEIYEESAPIGKPTLARIASVPFTPRVDSSSATASCVARLADFADKHFPKNQAPVYKMFETVTHLHRCRLFVANQNYESSFLFENPNDAAEGAARLACAFMFCWEGAAGRTRYFSGRLGEIFVDMEEGEMGIDNHDQNRLDDVAGSILPGAAIGKKQRSHLITIGNYALRSGTPVEWTFESTGVGSRSHKATVVLEGIHYTSRAAHAKRTEAKEDAAEVACLAKGITVESVAAMSLRPAGLGATANAVALLNQHCQNNNKVMVTRFERSPKGFFTCYITIDGLGEWNSIGDFEYSRKADAKMRACHQAAKELDLRSSMKPPRVSNEGHHMDYVPNHRKASSQTPTFEPQQKRARLDTVAASTSASARSSRSNSDKREQWRQPLSSAIFESSAQAQAVPHYPFPPQVLQQSFPLPGYQQPQYTMTPQPLFPYSSTPFLPQNLMPQPFPAQPFPAPPFPAQPHTFHYSMSPPPAPAQSGLMDIETAMRVFASVLSGPALGPPAPGNQGANTSVVSSASSGPHTHANPPPAGPSHNPG